MKLKKDKKEKGKKEKKSRKKDEEQDEEQDDEQPDYEELNAWLADPNQGVQGIIFEFEGGYYRVISAEKYG